MIFSKSQRSLSCGRGSNTVASSAAPPNFPDFKLFSNAISSTIPPLETITKKEYFSFCARQFSKSAL